MPTLEEVKDQIKRLDGVSKLLGRKEIIALPSILWEDEKLEKIVQGMYTNKLGILVATNKRLVFIDKGLIYGLRVEDFPYDKISSIQFKTGLMFGKITIYTSGNKAEIEQVYKDQTKSFCDYVRARISSPQEHASQQVNQSSHNSIDDVVSQLEKLAKLKDSGIITEEDFQKKKEKLLGI